jgi:hypothetical protein
MRRGLYLPCEVYPCTFGDFAVHIIIFGPVKSALGLVVEDMGFVDRFFILRKAEGDNVIVLGFTFGSYSLPDWLTSRELLNTCPFSRPRVL